MEYGVKENRFLHAENGKIIDGNGNEILLTGWGLGNWLVQEGYMWQADGDRFDRPARIEKIVEELTGREYAQSFWRQYRENYVRREDILKMAELGYNSVRIPFHYKYFVTDSEEFEWREEGFRLLDQCLSWCEEAGIYAFLDMHAAPGGQTGSNIDDSADNVPRLFLEEQNQKKCIALWTEIARRYRDKECVGGYDLLNEPIVPPDAGFGNFEYLIPRLKEFYHKLVAAIREVDPYHLLSIEGPHWAQDTSIFDQRYDENMVLHFHRYAKIPEIACLQEYIQAAQRIKVPLWMGETGENLNEWYTALYPLSHSLGIGYNLWTWKKMECTNSPYSIRRPVEYQKIMDYIKNGEHPGMEKAQEIFEEYLENIKIENCQENLAVTYHVFRQVPFSVRATDFDQCPGIGVSFSGTANETEGISYRKGCGMKLVEVEEEQEKRFYFDCRWDRFGLVLGKDEFACYQAEAKENFVLEIIVAPGYEGGAFTVGWKDGEEYSVKVSSNAEKVLVPMKAGKGTIKIQVKKGNICLERLVFRKQ